MLPLPTSPPEICVLGQGFPRSHLRDDSFHSHFALNALLSHVLKFVTLSYSDFFSLNSFL